MKGQGQPANASDRGQQTGEKGGKNFWDDCGVLFINRDGADHMRDLEAEGDMFPNVGMVAPAGRHRKAGAVEVAPRGIGSSRPDPEERRCV